MIPPLKFKFPEIPQFNFLIDLQGQSLYQKWLELGLGTGDYAAFLEWLRLKGDKGASAYDVAVELGFVGTLAEWVASLKGDKGDHGIQGIQGEKGDKGDQGIQGEKGEQGIQGVPGTTLHTNLTDKNSESAFQHVDERINEIPAVAGAASYTLLNRRQNLITGTLPNGVNSTLVIPALIIGERNEVILHFKTNAVAAPTLVYSGFTPAWLNGSAISMKINKQYTIVFEQINGIVKTSWGEY